MSAYCLCINLFCFQIPRNYRSLTPISKIYLTFSFVVLLFLMSESEKLTIVKDVLLQYLTSSGVSCFAVCSVVMQSKVSLHLQTEKSKY